MAAEVFTPAWGEEVRLKVNESEPYRTAAARWEWPLVLVLLADPDLGVEEQRSLYLDLYHGDCRDVRAGTEEDLSEVPYVIEGDPHAWRQVLTGRVAPVGALLLGKLRLRRGRVTELMAYVVAADELVKAARLVETSFPEAI